MPAIVTDRFRIKNAGDFIESVADDNIFLFVGKVAPWADDNAPPLPLDSVEESDYEHWEDMLGAKKVRTEDVVPMVTRHNWVDGALDFVAYNAKDAELFRSKFYALVELNGEFSVYKLLEVGVDANGDKKPLSDKPATTSPTTDSVVTTADGYVWKFMYDITAVQALKFLTPQHMPVFQTANNVLLEANNVSGNALTPNPTPVPYGGHGTDNVQELGAYYAGINVRLEFGEVVNGEETFTTENDFRKIGLLNNPLLADGVTDATTGPYRLTTRLDISNVSGTFQVDEVITTGVSGEDARVVYHDNTDVNAQKLFVNTILAPNYVRDTFEAEPGDEVTGETSGASADVDVNNPPQLELFSGEIMYMEYRKPIPRADDQIESLTVVLEF